MLTIVIGNKAFAVAGFILVLEENMLETDSRFSMNRFLSERKAGCFQPA